MKKTMLILLILVFLMAMTGVAYTAGYNHPTSTTIPPGDNPHGGYADTSNKCKTCHAVHLAEGSFRLLRGATGAQDECDYCHGSGGHTAVIVTTNGEGHTTDGGAQTAPDDCDPAWSTTAFRCSACHSPHDNDTVVLTDKGSSYLLKADPDPDESLYWDASVGGDESMWCSDCHSANYGLHDGSDGKVKTVGGETRYGHDSSDTGWVDTTPADGWPDVSPDGTNNGPTCKQCHQSGGYPHNQGGTTSRDMLKDSLGSGSSATQLDDVCNDCHFTPSLP